MSNKEVELSSNSTSNDGSELDCVQDQKLFWIYGDEPLRLATVPVTQGLLDVNNQNLRSIAERSLRIYSQVVHGELCYNSRNRSGGNFDDYLVKTTKTQPLKSFSKLMCPQMLKFTLNRSESGAIIDERSFFNLLEELRTSYDTLPPASRLIYRDVSSKKVQSSSNHVVQDASLIIQWACIESAKCLLQNHLGSKLSLERLLSRIMERIDDMTGGDKSSKKILSMLLCNIDKILLGYMSESSNGEQSLKIERYGETFNCDRIIWDWLLRNRPLITKFSLVVDEPAGCWWSFNLSSDLQHGSNSYPLLMQSAKKLGDLNLLEGLSIRSHDNITLRLAVKNMRGSFEEVASCMHEVGPEPDYLTLEEIFHASQELGNLEDFRKFLDQLLNTTTKSAWQDLVDLLCAENINKNQLETVHKLLSSWTPIVSPSEEYSSLDHVIPTCLNIAPKLDCDTERSKIFDEVENFLTRDFTLQCLNAPNRINPKHQIYFPLIRLLKYNDLKTLEETSHARAGDLRWNHWMYRSLKDSRKFDEYRSRHSSFDSIQFNASKFNYRKGNLGYASALASDLMNKAHSDLMRYNAKLLSLKYLEPTEDLISELMNCANEIQSSELNVLNKSDLGSKILRQIIRSPVELDDHEATLMQCLKIGSGTAPMNLSHFERWKKLISNCSNESKIRTLLALSKRLNHMYHSQTRNYRLLNDIVEIDLNLLISVCQSRESDSKSVGLLCASSILKHIQENWSELYESTIRRITSDNFLATTKKIWFEMRRSLLSTIIYKRDIGQNWRQALIKIVSRLSTEHPDAFIYDIVVNRLDLRSKLHLLGDKSQPLVCDSTAILLLNEDGGYSEEERGLNECGRQLSFWNFLLDHQSKSLNDWFQTFDETEKFIKEIRRVSYLCGEYLSTLATRIPKDLNNFRSYLRKICDSYGKLKPEHNKQVVTKLTSLCNTHQKAIEMLLNYKKINTLTKYEKWFFDTFSQRLRKIANMFTTLKEQRSTMDFNSFEPMSDHIAWELRLCEMDIVSYNHETRQQLFMELVSPILSRMQPSLIPMPGHCSKGGPVTIHKISQTIHLIASKNHPKKLKLIGSDGLARSFLLKAHDDLRLDQLLMDVFTSVNTLLSSSKTANNCRIKLYSVVPVSSRSGLIQWIDAPSLCSTYRSWALGSRGSSVLKKLYRSTCVEVCYDGNPKEPNAKHECEIPEGSLIMHPFRRILQAQQRSVAISGMRGKVDQKVRESCVKELMQLLPNQLISNELLYSSHNAHSFWLKTNTFISSWATMSIVGYIIGLGDRHLDNVLLDKATGEIIHVDFNICFELGKLLSVPEKVPFRLTRNIVHAFGFAGLEGGFTMNSRRILAVLRDHKKLLLHLLDPINLSFMVNDINVSTSAAVLPAAKDAESTNISQREQVTETIPEMCSQESVDIGDAFALKVDDTVEFKERFNRAFKLDSSESSKFGHKAKQTKCNSYQSQGIEHHIKTPVRLTPTSSTKVFKRITEKVSGFDSGLVEASVRCDTKLPLSVEDQVDCLISESTSIENLSAMYEGWAPWL